MYQYIFAVIVVWIVSFDARCQPRPPGFDNAAVGETLVSPIILSLDRKTTLLQFGMIGSNSYPADGTVFSGSVSIGVPNPSGYYSSSVGQSIVLGCKRQESGQVDDSCAAGGVNGGFGDPGSRGLQTMLNYGGVDAVGQFISAGPYQPPRFSGIRLEGINGTRVVLPAHDQLPQAFRRTGTWVKLDGLSSSLVGMISTVAADGQSFNVMAWGDQASKAVEVDARTYRADAAPQPLTATVGYVSSLFGYNHVVATYPTGPTHVVGGETDVICDRPGGCGLNSGVTVNGAGNYQNGTGLSCNGGVGGTKDVPAYTPAWTDCLTVRGFSYRGVYIEMNFNDIPASNATTGVYVDTIGTDGNYPFVVHNKTIKTSDGNSNVFSVDAAGNVFGRTVRAGGGIYITNRSGYNQTGLWDGDTGNIQTNGQILASDIVATRSAFRLESLTPTHQSGNWDATTGTMSTSGPIISGAVTLSVANKPPYGCGPDTLGAHFYIVDGRKPGERPGAGSGVPADCTPTKLNHKPVWVSVYNLAAVSN